MMWKSGCERLRAIKKQNFKTLAETWRSFEAVRTDKSTWGDEVEYVVVRLDHEAHEVHVSPRSSQILDALKARHPEELFDAEAYKYMLESQPRRPYGDSLRDLGRVDSNMRDRRRKIASCLSRDERVLTLGNIGLLGSSRMNLDYKSLVTDKQRYRDMINRVPKRAKSTSDDYSLNSGSQFASADCEKHSTIREDMIYGWGGCGLQVTFSANDLQQVCRLHDQLVPLGPLMLALSAATPVYKGRFVATDTRWEAMCRAGDDRKPSESPDIHPRLGCTPMYLEESASARRLNDQTLESIGGLKPDLRGQGVPSSLATYLSHILNRDPLIDAPNTLNGDDMSALAQSCRTNLMNLHMSTWWPHVRLKLPVVSTVDDSLPWRVEFRPMDAQPSDMENAALVVATRILQQTIQHFDLDLRIPISAVKENMSRANARAAATDQMFRFAVRIGHSADASAYAFDGWASLDTVFNGGDDGAGRKWRGLLPLANDYLVQRDIPEIPCTEQEKIFGALEILSARASGRLQTPAQWMRNFIRKHSYGDLANEEISAQVYYAMILALSA